MVGKTNETPSKEDPNNYTFVISDITLFVQIGTLNAVLYSEIQRRWTKEDILYFFRRFDLLELNVGIGTGGLVSETLWCATQNPVRIYFFLVNHGAFKPGAYSKNPVSLCS